MKMRLLDVGKKKIPPCMKIGLILNLDMALIAQQEQDTD